MATFGGLWKTAETFLRSAVKQQLGGSAFYNTLREADRLAYKAITEPRPSYKSWQAKFGVSYRKGDVLADYRREAGIQPRIEPIKSVRHDYHIGTELYTPAGKLQRTIYRYQVTGTIYNPETKERLPFTTNVASDRELTPGEIHSEALEPIKRSTEAYKSDIEGYVLEAAYMQ